jgi:hypothetical protein
MAFLGIRNKNVEIIVKVGVLVMVLYLLWAIMFPSSPASGSSPGFAPFDQRDSQYATVERFALPPATTSRPMDGSAVNGILAPMDDGGQATSLGGAPINSVGQDSILTADRNATASFVASNLLPKKTTDKQAQEFMDLSPAAAGNDAAFGGMNLLGDTARYAGVDTQNGSLRNSSHDLRASPVIPKKTVSPWLMSSIESDPYRRPLDGIGCSDSADPPMM